MLDAFKKTGKTARTQAEELEALIATCREERAALSTMLTQMQLQTTKLATAGKTLQEVDEKAGKAHARLDEVVERLSKADARAGELEHIDTRIQALSGSIQQAEQTTARLTASDGALEQHKTLLQTLMSQGEAARESLEGLQQDRTALDALREELRHAQAEVRGSRDDSGAMKRELETLRTETTDLVRNVSQARDLSRETREQAETTTALVVDVEKRLGPLAELQELSRNAEERMASLNALAEHVNQKIKSLENQKHTVERAVVESNRLNEMIWAMDVQIGKLNEGGLQASRTEELIERVEALARDVAGQIEVGTKAREGFERDLTKLDKNRITLAEFVHGFTDRLTVERKALDAFDERSRVLQASIAEAEKKVDEQAARDRRAQAFDQRAALMTQQLEALHAQAGELQIKHSALESLQDSLAEVDVLAKKTASQYESLKHGRQEIDAFRAEIQEVFKSHASAIQLRDRLSSDRAALESFIDRTDAFSAGVPQLQTQLNAIAQKLATIEAGSQQAEKLAAVAADLERQMKRIAGQEQFVERVGARLEALSALTVEVDSKMGDQISRRGEVDTLRSQMEGVTIQVADARQKLEDVSVLQEQLVPLTTQLSELAHQIETAQARFRATQKDEATLADQERRLAALDDSARTTSQQVTERLTQVHALSDELGRSVEARDRLLEELANVQARQHDVATQMDAADGQLARLDATAKDLEQRGSQLAFAEKRIGAFEGRLVDLSQMANQIESTIQTVAERESVVDAVRKEVHCIHELSARSKSDLEHVESHRAEMVTLREQLDGLLAAIAETETRIAAIDGRRKVVDEVQLKTNAIVNMLEDVRLNMDTLGEHKTIMEQAMGDFARLTELVQESQTTLRALKAERELAGRIERGTKRLRAKTDRGQSTARPAGGQDATA